MTRLEELQLNVTVRGVLPDSVATVVLRLDLIVCDEANKMSAFGGEIKYTKRYRPGQLLSMRTRHFLPMTATPHNGRRRTSSSSWLC